MEVADEWFCEATWAGPFQDGGFDQTDIVAGSGGRVRDGQMVFVTSGSTVDRLQALETPTGPWVSNSLACLLAASGARIDEATGKYFWIFRTIVGGLGKYRRTLPTSAGPVQLVYFDNFVWDGATLSRRAKPGLGRDFSTFDRYASFLERSTSALAENAGAPQRGHKYELLSTASSGYDSSTVTVLARRAGATMVLSFDQARRGLDDSGEPLARCLGMTPITVQRSAWMENGPLPEVPFLASDAHGGDVFFSGAGTLLANKVLLTGYHGDKVWAKESPSCDASIVRGDQSGLSVTEYRLGIGMIHCPISFWGVRQIRDLHAISNAPDMAPWDVPGDYSRPICRRIVESAGVPRELFGQAKKATWVLLLRNRNFLSPTSASDYFAWLSERRWQWIRRGRMPPLIDRRVDHLESVVRKTTGQLGSVATPGWYATALKASYANRVAQRISAGPTHLRRYLFPWALGHQQKAYGSPF
ncbi:MAG TPA: hypothetical protein VFX12_04395 [Vicinamibacterales bacterium]|nr:hypothetical protein [Vicinamibacterales bacterium]